MSDLPPDALADTTTERQLLTVIAESVLESRLIDDVKRAGAKGYSVTHVRGEGATGRQALDFAGPSVRLESVVTDEVAVRVLEVLRRDYFKNYAVVAWIAPVRVARPERF